VIFVRTLVTLLGTGTAISSPILAQTASTPQPGIAVQAWLPASQAGFSDGAMARSRVPRTGHRLDAQDQTATDEGLSIGTQYIEEQGSRDDHEARLRALDREARRGTVSAEVYAAQVRRILGGESQ